MQFGHICRIIYVYSCGIECIRQLQRQYIYFNKIQTSYMLYWESPKVKVQRHHLVVEGALQLQTPPQQVRTYVASCRTKIRFLPRNKGKAFNYKAPCYIMHMLYICCYASCISALYYILYWYWLIACAHFVLVCERLSPLFNTPPKRHKTHTNVQLSSATFIKARQPYTVSHPQLRWSKII